MATLIKHELASSCAIADAHVIEVIGILNAFCEGRIVLRRSLCFCAVLLCCVALPLLAQDSSDEREQGILKRYVELLEKQPKLGTAFDRVYKHHVERGSVDVFLAPYREKTTGEAALLVGLVEAQRGREVGAAKAFASAEKLRPSDPLPAFYLARVLAAEHDFVGAAAACERALSKQPQRAELLEVSQLLAQVLTRNGQQAEALKVWLRLETQFATDARVQERVARGLLDAGDVDAARARFEKLSKQSTDPTARVQFAIKAAELQLQAKQRDEAIAALDRLLDGLKPDSWPARLVSQRIEEAFLRDDDLKGLETYYRARLTRAPNDVEGQVRFARLLARQQRVEDAVAALRELVKKAPSVRTARQALIDLLVAQQQWGDVAKEHAELDRLSPGDADNVRAWGQAVLRDESRAIAERRSAAESIWKRLLTAKPKDAAAHVQVAEWLRSIDRTDEAIALYRRAIELAPQEAQYREALGEFLFALDRKADAIATWREIASGSRKSAESFSRVGQLLKNHDDVAGAIAAYAEAIKLESRVADLLTLARLQRESKQFDASVKHIEQAGSLAESQEDRQQVESEELATLQAADRIGPELQRLRALVLGGTSLSPQGEGRATQTNATRVADAMRLARLSLLIERLDDALVAARMAVKIDDSSIAARTMLATIAQQAKQWVEAAEQREWLVEHDRRVETAHISALIEIRREQQDFAKALKASERLLAIAPDHPEHRRVQSELLFELKRDNEGLAALREAARRGGDANSWSGLAAKLGQLNRKDEAFETYWYSFSLAKNDDERFAIVRALGKLSERQGASRRSPPMPSATNPTATPKEGPAASALPLTSSESYFTRIVQRLERQRFEGQQDLVMRRCLVELHRSVGDSKTAIELLRSLLADEPNNARTLEQLIALAQASGDRMQAIEFQRQLVALDPSTANERQLASMLFAVGKNIEHSVLLQRLAARSMTQVERLQFVDDLVKANEFAVATEMLEADLKRQPNDWESLYRLALVKQLQGRISEATRYFARLRTLRPATTEPVGWDSVPTRSLGLQSRRQSDSSESLGASTSSSLRSSIALQLNQRKAALQDFGRLVHGGRTPLEQRVAGSWKTSIEFDLAATVALCAITLNARQAANEDAPVAVPSEGTRGTQSTDVRRPTEVLRDAERELADDSTPATRLWDWLAVRDALSTVRAFDPKSKKPGEQLYPGPLSRDIALKLARQEPIAGSLFLLMWFNEATGTSFELRLNTSPEEPFVTKTDALPETIPQPIPAQGNREAARLIELAPATLDALLAAFDKLRGSHSQHLRVEHEVAQLIRQLHFADRHADAERVLEHALPLARHGADFAAVLSVTAGQSTRAAALAALKQRLQDREPLDANAMHLVLDAFDPTRELAQRVEVAEWFIRQYARESQAPSVFPNWLLAGAVTEVVDKPLPQHSKPSPFVIVTDLKPSGTSSASWNGKMTARLYSVTEFALPAVLVEGDVILSVSHSLFGPYSNRRAIAELLKGLEQWKATTQREEEVFAVLRGAVLHWNGQPNEAEKVFKELLAKEPESFPQRVALAALLAHSKKFEEALRLLDEAKLSQAALIPHRERYALQLAERLKDKARAVKAAGVLAKAELESDVWYEVARLCVATDRDNAAKLFLSQSTPPQAEVGNRMFELPAAYLICGESDKAFAATLRVLKTLPANNPQLVPLFRYQPGYWERLKALATLLADDAVPEQRKVVALIDTILFHNRWTEQTRYSSELQIVRAKFETQSPRELADAAKQKADESKFDEAYDLYLRACLVRSETLEERLPEIEAAFTNAKRIDLVIRLLNEIDLRALPKASQYAVTLARSRITTGQGALGALKLLRSGSTALPEYQQVALRVWKDEDAAQHWPFFLVRYEDLFPVSEAGKKRQWLGVDERPAEGNSRNSVAFEDIVPALSDMRVRNALMEETAKQRKLVPQWLAGEFYLAFLELNDNQFDAARTRLQRLANEPIPTDVQGQLARMIARVQNAEAVAIAFIERLCEREPDRLLRLNDQPAWHLAWMHSKRGERQHIEAALARAVAQQEKLIDARLPQEERLPRRYQLWMSHVEVLQEFACSGESLRQLRRLHQHATSISPSERPKAWDLAHPQLFNQERVRTALANASFEESSRFLADFVTLADEKPESVSHADLLLDVTSPGLASSPLTSFMELCLEAASKLEDRERLNLLRERLAAASKLQSQRSSLGLEIARCRLALLDAESPEARLKALQELVTRLPEFPLPPSAMTATEQRATEDRIALWLIARTIRAKDDAELKALRATLESAALEAAQRHPREAWRETIQAEQRRGL